MLRKNQVLTIGKQRYKVLYVNATGAYVVPLEKKVVSIGAKSFTVARRGMVISADSQPQAGK